MPHLSPMLKSPPQPTSSNLHSFASHNFPKPMATVVYQGSQSCLDNSQLVEARMLRLRLSSPKPNFSPSLELATKGFVLDTTNNTINELGGKIYLYDQQASSNRDSGCWTFFHSLYNPNNKETGYTHPLVKHSSSRLSEKSLEMCTESLGSETGSDVSGNISLLLSSSCSKEDESLKSEVPENSVGLLSCSASKQKSCQLSGSKQADSRGFPPPLTTMNGSGSLHVRPTREDGRLIIQAIKSPSTRPCLRAERRNGRLRLSLVEDSFVSSSSARETRESIPEGIIIINNKDESQEEMDDVQDQVEDGNESNDLDVEAEMGSGEFRRARRCKEGELENKILLNLEPFWVASS